MCHSLDATIIMQIAKRLLVWVAQRSGVVRVLEPLAVVDVHLPGSEPAIYRGGDTVVRRVFFRFFCVFLLAFAFAVALATA